MVVGISRIFAGSMKLSANLNLKILLDMSAYPHMQEGLSEHSVGERIIVQIYDRQLLHRLFHFKYS